MLTITDYGIIALYFVIILAVGFWTGKGQEKEEFLISGRKLPWSIFTVWGHTGILSGRSSGFSSFTFLVKK
jgi:Na+/proline symporter